ncbi:MAG: DNA mismatch repair protein MutS, partial [Thermoprotei archaeon]
MAFQSILFIDPAKRVGLKSAPPDFFVDLGLDGVAKELVKGFSEFGVESVFYTPLESVEEIVYRQEVFADLGDQKLMGAIRTFSDRMRTILAYVGNDRLYEYQRLGVFLKSVLIYCDALRELLDALSTSALHSEGLRGFRDYLSAYLDSGGFRVLKDDAEGVRLRVTSIGFCVTIKGGSITVAECEEVKDYSEEVEEVFERFRYQDSGGEDESVRRPVYVRGHVEEAVLELAAKLHPKEFGELSAFYTKHRDFIDETVVGFYREIQFYLAYLKYVEPIRRGGLPLCIPRLTLDKAAIVCRGGFDMALAARLLKSGSSVVTNDFYLAGDERIIIVTGPNHGGKTTFAREFAQIHYLGKLGVPVPGSEATLFLFDNIFTLFERGEAVESLRGKLEDEIVRIKGILERASDRSILVVNEMLGSTAVRDAAAIGRKILRRIVEKGCICVYVTFVDELALVEGVVSYVGQVDPDNPEKRTFKVVRQPPNGLAYALGLAK